MGLILLQSSDSQIVVAGREAEARDCRRNKILAMKIMPALEEPDLRESTKGWKLEGTTSYRPYRALKGENLFTL